MLGGGSVTVHMPSSNSRDFNKTYNNDLSCHLCCGSGSEISFLRIPDQTHISDSLGNKFLYDEQFKIVQQL